MPKLSAAIIPVTPFQQNCTLLWDDDSKRGVVIDPGGDVDQIVNGIEQTGMEVEFILLTHGHIDHAGGAADLRDRLGVELVGPHEDDRFLLDGLEAQGAEYGFAVRNVTPNRWLDEGTHLDMAGGTWEIRHCPGHSPGSLVYVNHEAGLIIMGDVVFKGSVGRTDFPGYGDTDQLMASIRDKILVLPDEMTFICGHGPASTIGDERATNPFLQQASQQIV